MKNTTALAICASLFTAGLVLPIAAPAFAQSTNDSQTIQVEQEDDDSREHRKGFWQRIGFKDDDRDDDDCRRHGRHGGRHGMKGMMRLLGGTKGNLDLTPDRLREIAEGFIAFSGNANLKVGDVAVKDDKTLTLNIVTQDGSAVESFEIDRQTGRPVTIR